MTKEEESEFTKLSRWIHRATRQLKQLDQEHHLLKFRMIFRSKVAMDAYGSEILEELPVQPGDPIEDIMVEYLAVVEDAVEELREKAEAKEAAAEADTDAKTEVTVVEPA